MASKVFEVAFKLGAELEKSFKNTFKDAGGAITVLGGAIAALGSAAALGSVVSQVADMNESLSGLSAQTGIVGQDFEELKDVAENLFRNNYGEDFDEVTAALANVKQNMHELSDADLEQFTGNALMFSKTFEADINEVTRAANNMMSAFGTDSEKAMDLFTTGAQRGLNFSDEMLDNVAEYAPLFGAMGYSAEEYFGIMERGAQAGVYNLDYVNDVMKEFQIRAKDGSKTTSDAMGALSKDTQNVWKEFLKGNGTVSDVASTVVGELKGMDDQIEANQIAVSLFGTKWEDLEADAMYAMLGTQDAMQGFEGAIDSVNQIQFGSFNAAMSGIGRILLMDIVYPIGEFLLPYLNKFAKFLSANIPVAIKIAKSIFESMKPTLMGMIDNFSSFGGVISSIATKILPILVSTVQMVFPFIVSIVQTTIPVISSIISTIASILTNFVIPAVSKLLQIIQFVFPFIQQIIQNSLTIISGIIMAAMSLIQGDWSGAWELIKGTAETIMNNIVSFFQGINLFEVGKSVITGLIDGIKSMGSAVIGAIYQMIPAPIRSAVEGLIGDIPEFAKGGIVDSTTLALVGEGGDTESIIPWNNSRRSKDLWLQTGQAIGMLGNSGLVAESISLQQNGMLGNGSIAVDSISPQQVIAGTGGEGGQIVIQYSPQYSVTNTNDLEQVQQHANRDKDDLLSRLAEIKRNETRLAFG